MADPKRDDSAVGMAWWNAMDDDDRRFWMAASMGASASDAWEYFKRCQVAGGRLLTPDEISMVIAALTDHADSFPEFTYARVEVDRLRERLESGARTATGSAS